MNGQPAHPRPVQAAESEKRRSKALKWKPFGFHTLGDLQRTFLVLVWGLFQVLFYNVSARTCPGHVPTMAEPPMGGAWPSNGPVAFPTSGHGTPAALAASHGRGSNDRVRSMYRAYIGRGVAASQEAISKEPK